MDGKLNIHPKVAASFLASWVTVIVVYSLHTWAHVDLPIEVGAALTGLVGFGAGWLAPNRVAAAGPAEVALATVPTPATTTP